jgi:hypothetical protein
VGVGVVLATLPLPAWTAKQMMASRREKMKASDARVHAVAQTMGVVRMVKLFAWEARASARLAALRDIELGWIRYNAWLYLGTYVMNVRVSLFLCSESTDGFSRA